MNISNRNFCLPGAGFLFTQNGKSLEEMAIDLHAAGYLTDAEMADGGGVPALRRKLYDETTKNRQHYSAHRKVDAATRCGERTGRAKEEKLTREVNAYADAIGVNDPKYMDMIILPEYLEKFGIEVCGKNLVDAELFAKLSQINPAHIKTMKCEPSKTMLRIQEMVRWVLAERGASNFPDVA